MSDLTLPDRIRVYASSGAEFTISFTPEEARYVVAALERDRETEDRIIGELAEIRVTRSRMEDREHRFFIWASAWMVSLCLVSIVSTALEVAR